MASIGAQSCTFVHDRGRKGPRQRTIIWQNPGMDGYGAQTLGEGDAEFQVEAVLYDTTANIDTWAAAIEAMQGTVISIVDDRGTTHTSNLIVNVAAPMRTPALASGVEERASIMISGVKIA